MHGLESNHVDSDGHSESHSPESCAVCAVAATSMISVSSYVVIDLNVEAVRFVGVIALLPDSLVLVDNHKARAPPLA